MQIKLSKEAYTNTIIPRVGKELAFVVFQRTHRENRQTQIQGYNLLWEKEPKQLLSMSPLANS